MGLFRRRAGPLLLCSILLGLSLPASAISVSFSAVDLPDLAPGHDLWSYEYLVGGFDYGANVSFSIYFDAALFTDLEDPPPPVGPDWDPIVLQPDADLPGDGLYDALALVALPATDTPFRIRFEWLGGQGAHPGSQPFDVTRFDEMGVLIEVIASGNTVLVPEPSTLSLLVLALGAGGMVRRVARG